MLDLLIIGGGPIGLACGLEAHRKGLNYLIVEKGCLVNSLYNYPLNMTFFSTSDRLELGEIPFVSNSAKPTRTEALEYYRRVSFSNQLKINLFEEVLKVNRVGEKYEITTSKALYQAQSIVIATGFYDLAQTLNVPGEDLPKVSHYYREPHFYAYQNLAVVGANNSAVDAALECYRKGANVTMIVRSNEIGQRVKYWVRPDIVNRIKEGSIQAFFESSIIEITDSQLRIQTPEAIKEISNDYVLAMTGYQPNLAFLKDIGIHLSADEQQKPSYNPDTMESNMPNVFLAGVICGGMDTHTLFIENSREHAEKIIATLKDRIQP
jgi:thioredoxin reductase (NADPH)